ncbi:probable galactinol--sucrose galactosyltransferase 2 isoform X3 [Cicer arietinum]|uniref:probable galactinol--sucrose galactosyltransferase 2 isoform X3 n=1 Tax=Cicer arietinum TaxID=3827 RepID=UPI003CC60223
MLSMQSYQLLLERQMISGLEILHPTQFTLHQWHTILFSLVNLCSQMGTCFHPGHHDFNLLKKLVLPDGSMLRAKLPGRPTKDCLFADPARDGKSLLKIWNMNDFCGVIGVFNCQGAGWCKVEK